MKSVVLKSPAKLNLFLQVLSKREDGFHNISTLFQRISLYDEMAFKSNLSGRILLDCGKSKLPIGRKNLVFKVAELLKQEYGVRQGVDIKLKKRIPIAAGLAGGSSNAATALLGLSNIWGLNLKRLQLLSYANKLGSDISFFLHDESWALGTGRGEIIQPLKIDMKLWYVLVVPCVKVYSSKVYQGLKLQLTKVNDNVNILIHNLKNNSLNAIDSLLRNDLEPEVIRFCPQLLKLKERLKSFDSKGVMVSGSGPSVFALTESEKKAKKIASILSKKFTRVYVVRTF